MRSKIARKLVGEEIETYRSQVSKINFYGDRNVFSDGGSATVEWDLTMEGRSWGVKDLDVWSFFALPQGVTRFPADKRNVHVDFGASTLGRQPYQLDDAPNTTVRARWAKWATFEGRRVDLLMRGLQCSRRSDPVDVIRGWLITGQAKPGSSPDRLAKKAMIMIDPADRRGQVVWPPDYVWSAVVT